MATSQNPITRPNDRIGVTGDLSYRDSHEIRRRIDQTRGAMDETLEEIGDRLNPRRLMDDVLDVFRSPGSRDVSHRILDAANDFATNFGRQVRDNPIGATLVAAGFAWMAIGNRRTETCDYPALRQDLPITRADRSMTLHDEDQGGYYTDDDLLLDVDDNLEDQSQLYMGSDVHLGTTPAKHSIESTGVDRDAEGDSLIDQAKEKVSSAAAAVRSAGDSTWKTAKDAAGSTAQAVSGAVSSAVGSAGDASRRAYLRSRAAVRDSARQTRTATQGIGRYVSETGSRSGDQVRMAWQSTTRRVETAHRETPLALGLGVLAVGAICGALLPRTRREDELMGEASDQLYDQVKQAGQDAYQQGRQAVMDTVDTAKESAASHGLTGESLAERASHVVEKVIDTVSESVKEEGLHPSQLKEDAKEVAQSVQDKVKGEAESAMPNSAKSTGSAETSKQPSAEIVPPVMKPQSPPERCG